MNNPQHNPNEESDFPVAEITSTHSPSKIAGVVVSRLWLATALCLLVALGLVWLQVRSAGPAIEVHFSQGHGLQPGDPVRFRGIDVGQVHEIVLDHGLDGIIARIRLTAAATALAREGARFWIERPDISVGQVRGLDTLVGGRYVGVVPGPNDAPRCNRFYGLKTASAPVDHLANGLEIILEGKNRSGLQEGSPISYRGVVVGQILAVGLTNDAATVEARAFVKPNYRGLIRENTRFWSNSGLDVRIGLGGIELDAETLATIAAGGVALATPNQPGRLATTGHRFELFESPREDWIQWQPRLAIGTAALPLGATTPRPILGIRRQQGALAMLGAGRQRGWLLQLSNGKLLGPANVLMGDSSDTEYLLEVSGQEVSLPLDDLASAGPLAMCRLPKKLDDEGDRWPAKKMRAPDAPEEAIVTCGSDDTTLPISTERLTVNSSSDTLSWDIDPSVPVDDQWHGASVVATRDGALIGILIHSDGRSRIVPLAAELIGTGKTRN